MDIQQLNIFLKNEATLYENKPLLYVFLTGASGAGKTHLAKALKERLDPGLARIEFFDIIDVPSLEEMKKNYGSGEKWQEAMTHKWVHNLSHAQKAKIVVLEGQFNPQFTVDACKKKDLRNYLIIAIHSDKETRDHRLIEKRKQPELANEDMENWAQFIKTKTLELGGEVIETTHSNIENNLNDFARLIEKAIKNFSCNHYITIGHNE